MNLNFKENSDEIVEWMVRSTGRDGRACLTACRRRDYFDHANLGIETQMMEKVMKGRMPATQAGTVSTTYKKVASGEKVNQWVCAKYEGYRENKKVKEVWTTDWKSFGLTTEAFNMMKEISEFFEGFAKDMAAAYDKIGSEEWEKEQGYGGVPVKTLSFTGGRLHTTTEVTEVRRENLSASLFELPSRLTKKEMPSMQTPKH